jgi:murein DD-endopeptidase MepM/ murein hydrolase activator NlpD
MSEVPKEIPTEVPSEEAPPAGTARASLAERLDSLRAFGRRLGRRLLWVSLVVLVFLAFWGALDLDRRVRDARHDGETWQDLEKGTERFTDTDALVAESAPAVVIDEAETLVDRALVALRLRELLVPVRDIESEDLYDSFGDARSGGRRHRSIDISAPKGTPVLATDDGTITSKSTGELGGKYLFQTDETGSFIYYYAHLDGYAWGLREGDRVRRGDVLGYVGTTGNAPIGAPHLHFAIYKVVPGMRGPGVPVNPYEVLRGE